MIGIDKFKRELETYFAELPEYEKFIDYIHDSSEVLAKSIFTRVENDDNFLKKIFKTDMSVEKRYIVLPEHFKVLSMITIEQTSEMRYDEILVNGEIHKLPEEISLEKIQNSILRCDSLYDILYEKGFNYTKNTNKYFVKGVSEFKIYFGVTSSYTINKVHGYCIRVEDLIIDIVKPNLFQILCAKLKNKKPVTKFIMKIKLEYTI